MYAFHTKMVEVFTFEELDAYEATKHVEKFFIHLNKLNKILMTK